MLRLLWISTSMFLSVLMAAVIFAMLGLYASDTLFVFIDWGKWLVDQIYHMDFISTQAMIFIDFLIAGNQIVFLALVIFSRILLSLLGMAASALRG